jgi:hypothetical protein
LHVAVDNRHVKVVNTILRCERFTEVNAKNEVTYTFLEIVVWPLCQPMDILVICFVLVGSYLFCNEKSFQNSLSQ